MTYGKQCGEITLPETIGIVAVIPKYPEYGMVCRPEPSNNV